MSIERHETGPRMSKAVIHGNTGYLAGIVADEPKGKSVPEKTTTEPAAMTTGIASASAPGTSSPQRWLPAITSVAPFSSVKSSIAQMALTLMAGRGRGSG